MRADPVGQAGVTTDGNKGGLITGIRMLAEQTHASRKDCEHHHTPCIPLTHRENEAGSDAKTGGWRGPPDPSSDTSRPLAPDSAKAARLPCCQRP